MKNLPIEPMKWRSSLNSSFLEDCPFDEACVGNVGNETESVCADGYEGPLCAVCSSSYSAKGSGQLTVCEKCDGNATVTIVIYCAGLVIVIIGAVLFCKYRKKAAAALRDLEERGSNSVVGRASERFDEASEIWEKVQPVIKIISRISR